MQPLWSKAEVALKAAERIVVFGYSCPALDFESANLLMRALRQNQRLSEFHVIDPNPAVFKRYVDLMGKFKGGWHYFRTARDYIRHMSFHSRNASHRGRA
jgi:hypothetical protein